MPEVQFIDLSGEIKAGPRGTSFFPWQDRLQEPGDLLRTFHLVSIHSGQTRGQHLHPGHEEWLYPFHGVGVFIWEAAPGQVRQQVIQGGRTLIRVPPGCAHAVTNPGPEILYLLAWRQAAGPGPADPETVPRPLDT
jgi:oxalate decarboxylase/phosphoglucose isomerase-like protein (cupin superfamily)